MGGKRIPNNLAIKVIELYLQGKTTRKIGDFLGISKTAVSKIVNKDVNAKFPIHLQHVLAVNLKKNGMDMQEYADLIRAKAVLKENGFESADVADIIVRLVNETFALGLEPEELVKFLYSFSELRDESKTRNIKDLAKYVQKQVDRLHYTNIEVQERSLELLKLKEQIKESERKLRQDYDTFGLLLGQKDKCIREFEAKIKKMEAERPPDICPVCAKKVESAKLFRLGEKIGGSPSIEMVVRKAQDLMENPHNYAYTFLPHPKIEEDDDRNVESKAATFPFSFPSN